MKKVFIFDLDDTLMWNEYTYSIAFTKFYFFLMHIWKKRLPYIGDVGAKAEEITYRMIKEINPDTNMPYGFAMERYPSSLVCCYEELCSDGFGIFQKDTAEKIYAIGLEAFDKKNYQKNGFVPGAKNALSFLKEKGEMLILMTKGDPRVQQLKIDALSLPLWFNEISIVDNKTPELFIRYKERFAGQPIWKIGNSFNSDMKPAVEGGIKGIFIPYSTWKNEKHCSDEARACKNIIIIPHIKEIIPLYEKGIFDQGGKNENCSKNN